MKAFRLGVTRIWGPIVLISRNRKFGDYLGRVAAADRDLVPRVDCLAVLLK